jgi:hypothetical protein
MPDVRRSHFTYPAGQPSLLNQKTEPFRGAATALYTDRGPARSELDYRRNAGRKVPEGEPQSIADHVDQAIAKVQGLNPRQRLAIHNAMVNMMHDVRFLQMLHSQVRDPWIKQDEGRPI